ncbi:MAG: RNA polymerase sigma factor RpoD/SigA [Bacteroidaceae bacterium]|jgi:RNA polymerase primary sigma factor|nr:RNA polymerase sigma factor RpoD/SigA [Bacteroidaceae bacterium]MBR4366439.1 RNA polymerase sigma factor RpoD/SigA [Bacteroidaceae bacterium]
MRELKINYGITDRTNESVNKYLTEVNKKEMISPEQEVELAQRIRKGDEKAVTQLVEANLRFVVSVAKQYQNRGMPLSDLIEEGNLGLIKAANMFDETRGFKFISYAVWWVRQAIHQALANNGNMVRLPINKSAMLSKIFSYMAQFYQDNEREPSPSEISEALGFTEDQVRSAMGFDGRSISISTPLGGDSDNGTMEDTMKSEIQDTDHGMDRESLMTDIRNVLMTLAPRERKIEMMFFGIGQPACSATDVANELHLTRERVRQVHEKNLKKLKSNPQVCKMLQKYLGN